MKAHSGLLMVTVACGLAAAAFAQEAPGAPATPPRPRREAPAAQQATAPSTEPAAPPAAREMEQEPQRPAREAPRERERREESQPAEERGERGGTNTAFHFDMKEAAPSVSHHQVEVNGRPLRYTATAGRLPVKNGEGTTEALMFYVGYTLDGADASRRPLTFAYNGGPGSASIWLHMGALGPRTVTLDPQGFMPQPPFRLHDNPYTPLGRTDLVLVDAVGTGWSRPADAAAARKYENPEGDIEAFSEFIRLYLTRQQRWGSPLYLFGESYGTTRSAGIAGYLQGRGVVFNGIGLLSMALNFQTLSFSPANDTAYPWNLPTYMAIAYYHHRLAPELQQAIDRCQGDPDAPCAPLLEAEEWAISEYATSLSRGDSRSAEERQRVIDRLSRYTGLPKAIVDEHNLRIDVGTFCHYLLLEQRLRVGRLDGRYALPEPDFPGGRGPGSSTDPSSTQTVGPFTMTFNQYVRTELGYKTDLPYYTSARDSGMFLWSAGGGTASGPGSSRGFQEEITPLRAAIVGNPYLKVLVMEAYYDLATPYLQAEYTMHELNLPASYQKNVAYQRYWSGHMVYLEQKSHAKLQRDWDGFVERTQGR
ncbi:MAG TPA: peptidase S10 [Vicinamibacteria bacterium]|nr:peptidase S10 [Vicinamibacteria bacterium]